MLILISNITQIHLGYLNKIQSVFDPGFCNGWIGRQNLLQFPLQLQRHKQQLLVGLKRVGPTISNDAAKLHKEMDTLISATLQHYSNFLFVTLRNNMAVRFTWVKLYCPIRDNRMSTWAGNIQLKVYLLWQLPLLKNSGMDRLMQWHKLHKEAAKRSSKM